MGLNLVNKYQDKGERRFKYQLLKNAGACYPLRQRARDWTMNHITLLIKSNDFRSSNYKK